MQGYHNFINGRFVPSQGTNRSQKSLDGAAHLYRSGKQRLRFVVAGILSWCLPFFLIARKAGSAVVGGNTIVIKPSEETPHNAVKSCELVARERRSQAGVPCWLVQERHRRRRRQARALRVHADPRSAEAAVLKATDNARGQERHRYRLRGTACVGFVMSSRE